MQQVMIDVTLSDGKMWQDIKKIENQLYQLTCEIRLAMYVYKVSTESETSHQDDHVIECRFFVCPCSCWSDRAGSSREKRRHGSRV